MKIEWTVPAVESLQGIHDYIARDQPFYAARFIDRLVVASERLADFPDLGRRVPEAEQNAIRELLFQGYRVIYRRIADKIQILAVVHGSRDLAGAASKPWEIG